MRFARNAAVLLLLVIPANAQSTSLLNISSPDGNTRFSIGDGPFANAGTPGAPQQRSLLHYRVAFRSQPIIADSELGLDLQDQTTLGSHLRQTAVRTSTTDETWSNPLGKSSTVHNRSNDLQVDYVEDSGEGRHLTLEIRVFNDGVAFRYFLPTQSALPVARITHERTQFQFTQDATVYPLILQNFTTPYEDEYTCRQISNLHPDWLIGLPLLAELPGKAWVAITEANIDNYPGMYLRHEGDFTALLHAELSPRPDQPALAAISTTPLETPWRVIMIADRPGQLIESNIVLNLNPPSAIKDTSWIKPGKTAWDWWSGDIDKRPGTHAGMNTATMKHYIDFASSSGFPYLVVDEGWAREHHALWYEDIRTGKIPAQRTPPTGPNEPAAVRH